MEGSCWTLRLGSFCRRAASLLRAVDLPCDCCLWQHSAEDHVISLLSMCSWWSHSHFLFDWKNKDRMFDVRTCAEKFFTYTCWGTWSSSVIHTKTTVAPLNSNDNKAFPRSYAHFNKLLASSSTLFGWCGCFFGSQSRSSIAWRSREACLISSRMRMLSVGCFPSRLWVGFTFQCDLPRTSIIQS